MILADWEIERDVSIEPFHRTMVSREDEKKVISYGLSSYGYDVRLSDEFKLFTNVNSSLIDPKNFDDASFVDKKCDELIIPPNSFALGRTMEYLIIPDDVLAVCVGKSTYARCFTGDTKFSLVTGEEITFLEGIKRQENGERLFGYGVNNGTIVVTELSNIKSYGVSKLVEVTLDDGSTVRCTPDHEFLLRDGTYKQAKDLTSGQSLFPLYRRITEAGYEEICQVNHPFPNLVKTYRLSNYWNETNGVYEDRPFGFHCHHKDKVKSNNRPDNIEWMSPSDHTTLHNKDYWIDEEFCEHHRNQILLALEKLRNDPERYEKFCEVQGVRARDFWDNPKYEANRARWLENQLKSWTDERYDNLSRKMTELWQDDEYRKLQSDSRKKVWENASKERRDKQATQMKSVRFREDLNDENVFEALLSSTSPSDAAKLLNVDKGVILNRFSHLVELWNDRVEKLKREEFDSLKRLMLEGNTFSKASSLVGRSNCFFKKNFSVELDEFRSTIPNNHKVVSVKFTNTAEETFCLKSQTGNFALSAGVFVHNCGLILNVTPLEPGWEGYVTLEISNTTPLPAKVYAKEGICQFLFLRGEPCNINYRDRKGKYMYQKGVVTPRL